VANRLAAETSPYLRQHADNPVDWYPWGPEAFAEAARRDVPVLLSVGYSTCHWCHVMAHESFEDPAVAEVMNERFVNVKVDREERPDVDAVYMDAVQALTGRGGWPMTVFLTPDGRPFYAGTYFPPGDRPGMPGFRRVLDAVHDAWTQRRAEVDAQADRLRDAIAEQMRLGADPAASDLPDLDAVERGALAALGERFDAAHGGFGGAPKFPPTAAVDLLLRLAVRRAGPERDQALEMATTTLDAMAAGGIHDQIGGGFHRYSVDAFWLIPHFEKMLYDQALLLGTYLRAWLVTGQARYRRVVESTVDYVLADLRHPSGGICSARDADTAGVEGGTYLWTLAEIIEVCGDDAEEVIRHYGVTERGNFTDPHSGATGNVLALRDPRAEPTPALERARARLRVRRAGRAQPGLDDKVLLGWNALWARSLAEAAAALGRPDWAAAARANVAFWRRELRRPDGRLLRSWQGSAGARHLAYAEDYAACCGALVTLAELDDVAWLDDAVEVAEALVELFADESGFRTTGRDAETLVVTPRSVLDGAVPSEQALACDALLRLGALSGDARFTDEARRVLRVHGPLLERHPTAVAHLVGALERAVSPPLEVAVVGPPGSRRDALAAAVTRRLLPAAVRCVTRPSPAGAAGRSPLLAGRGTVDGNPAAYVCEAYTCRAPVTDPDALAAALDEAVAARRTAPGDAPAPGTLRDGDPDR
jgi:uncharacterized protein YyaL (SSP411 family)